MSGWGNDSWGNGPATSTTATDEWNSGSGGAASGNWGGDTGVSGFNDSSAAPAGDFGVSADAGFGGDGGDTGERSQGACFNCNEEGHQKADCPKPRVFTGECRGCGKEGHRASDCPEKPKFCRQCLAEGDHDTMDCKNNKVVDLSDVPDMTESMAWKKLQEASDDLDVDDFKDTVKILQKAKPAMTYPELERGLRKRGMDMYLIALQKEVAPSYSNVNLQGEVGKTFTLGVYTRSFSCPRPILMEAWPKSPEENLERLADAGVPLETGIPMCNNCGKVGHMRKNCDQEKEVVEGVKIHCVLCDSEGHRMRDCPEERPQKKERAPRTCRHCESEDHIARDCPDAPKPECRNCGETDGHRAADCPNERKPKCRNCDAWGHMSKDCKEAKDWSKVTCRHCGEKGHASEKMCNAEKKAAFQAAKAEAEAEADADGFGAAEDSGAGTGAGWNEASTGGGAAERSSWETTITPAPIAVGGGGGW